MPRQEQSDIQSEGLREFVSHQPGIFIRWGIPIFFLLLVGLAIGTYFIEYPDIVLARARVNSINPPRQVIAIQGGRLVKIFVLDNGDVEKGDLIGYLESTANHQEVLRLSGMLDTLQFFADSNQLEEIPRFWKFNNQLFTQLGELQQAHQTFMQGYITFRNYLNTGFYVARKRMLNTDLTNTRRLLQTLYQQKGLQEQDLSITVNNFNVHDTLHRENLINDIEYRNQQSQLIGKKMTIPQMNASIINNQTQQNALQKEMMELDNEVAQQRSLFVQSLSAYRSAVEEWKRKYLLIAAGSGKLSYAGFWVTNQLLQPNQVMGYITNESNQHYVEMLLPQANFGKVKPGQEVLLKFSSYPVQEYGSVKGTIEFIKSIPTDSGYLAKVILPNGLVTNYNKPLLFTEGLQAQAEIVTENRRLIDRFFGQIKNLLK